MFGRKWQMTFRVFYRQMALNQLRKAHVGYPVEGLMQLIYEKTWGLFKPSQIRSEYTELMKRVKDLKPKVILEIGTGRSGGNLFLYSRVAAQDALIISIDKPDGEFGGSYPAKRRKLFQKLILSTQRLVLLHEDSHEPSTVDKVKNILQGRQADYLFIDGDHTYNGVKMDFEMYSPFVRPGGLVGFHDVVEHSVKTGCEVYPSWNELKTGFKYEEIVEDWKQRWAGIGLVELPGVEKGSRR